MKKTILIFLFFIFIGIPMDAQESDYKKQNLEGISIFPNPASHLFQIRGAKNTEISKISLYNVLGKNVQESISKSYDKENCVWSIDISELSTGVYIVSIEQKSGETFTQKLVKQ
ncbi:hypothetical protein CL684_01440 [Candidatus Campbellbacteria bacterium]|nr:hypothetical protein [Candidatus Campbellbacteria bacterium]|tara:strand:+ start:721 stop:1062 length:342 start_codon:yes stop_codon:yes gene_type:complete